MGLVISSPELGPNFVLGRHSPSSNQLGVKLLRVVLRCFLVYVVLTRKNMLNVAKSFCRWLVSRGARREQGVGLSHFLNSNSNNF